jgi:hypothetical protein
MTTSGDLASEWRRTACAVLPCLLLGSAPVMATDSSRRLGSEAETAAAVTAAWIVLTPIMWMAMRALDRQTASHLTCLFCRFARQIAPRNADFVDQRRHHYLISRHELDINKVGQSEMQIDDEI